MLGLNEERKRKIKKKRPNTHFKKSPLKLECRRTAFALHILYQIKTGIRIK